MQLRNKSFTAILSQVVNLLWWFEWAAGISGVIMIFIAARIRREFALQIPISYSDISIRQIYPIKKNGEVGILNTTEGILSVHIDANWQNILMILAGYGLLFAVIVLITYQFKKILQSIKDKQPFQKVNIKRITHIALILIGYSVGQWLFVSLVNYLLKAGFIFRHVDLTYNFNLSCLLMGVVLLVLKEVFKTGLLLEEDKQLTI